MHLHHSEPTRPAWSSLVLTRFHVRTNVDDQTCGWVCCFHHVSAYAFNQAWQIVTRAAVSVGSAGNLCACRFFSAYCRCPPHEEQLALHVNEVLWRSLHEEMVVGLILKFSSQYRGWYQAVTAAINVSSALGWKYLWHLHVHFIEEKRLKAYQPLSAMGGWPLLNCNRVYIPYWHV